MTIAVDVAKDVFEVAAADGRGRIVERARLSRAKFLRFFDNRPACTVVMEACGSAQHWARTLTGLGFSPRLLPPQYVRPYRRRNKTDRSDCEALLAAAGNPEIRAVSVKTIEQQTIQQLHRVRSQWLRTRTARINGLRGMLRELGIAIPKGAIAAKRQAAALCEALPAALQSTVGLLLAEIRELELRMRGIERELARFAAEQPDIAKLQEVPGIGLLTATALWAAVADPRLFRNGRHLASWIGLTPREWSSGTKRTLGRISKRGDVYIRMLLTHGARSVLNRAKLLARAGKPLSRLQRWALQLEQRVGHNKATCALANKLARIAWALWRHDRAFNGDFTPSAAMAA
jgi:transposase